MKNTHLLTNILCKGRVFKIMLRLKKSELKLMTQGYHFDEHGKKFVRVWISFSHLKVQVKIQPHKEMHIKSSSVDFPYVITDNWVEMIFDWSCINEYFTDYINKKCKDIWFV